jgi:hypothetical protein
MSSPRPPNPWLEAAFEFGRAKKSFVAIDPRTNPKSWSAWRDYFRWLNWAPFWFLEVERKHDQDRESSATWTAPIEHPDSFTVAFKPVHGHPPRFPLTVPKQEVQQSTAQRVAHVTRVLGRKLGARDTGERKQPGWITPAQAAEILARHEREANQNQTLDEEQL